MAASPPHWLQKNSINSEVIKILVTNIIFCGRRYLKLPMQDIENFHSYFVVVILIFSLVTSTFHCSSSPALTPNNCTISFGNPTLNEFDLGFAIPILLLYLNIIIPPFLFLFSNIYGGYIIKKLLFKKQPKK